MEKFTQDLIDLGNNWEDLDKIGSLTSNQDVPEAILVSLLQELHGKYPGKNLHCSFGEKYKISKYLWEDFSHYCKLVEDKLVNTGRWTNVQEYILQVAEDLFVHMCKEVPSTEYLDCGIREYASDFWDVHLALVYPKTKTVTVYERETEPPVENIFAQTHVYRVFDVETNGLSESDVTVQVAFADCVLWKNQLFVMEAHQFLINRSNIQYAEAVPMKIPQSFLKSFGVEASKWFTRIKPSAYIAFNADFDVGMLAKDGIFLSPKEVLCAFLEIPWKKKASLGALCAEHGILIHNAHNALTDVLATVNLLNAQKEISLEEFLRLAEFEKVLLHADVDFKQKDLAKNKGYLWNTETRQWTKKIRRCHLKEPLEAWEIIKPLENSVYEEL